jgi:molybdenum cofactor synthesis domain-containing protein
MKVIPVEESIGTVLCHDITEIVPGKFKGRAFKKGHIIEESDIPILLRLGKEHLYVWELSQGLLHENEAATRLASAAAGGGIRFSEPVEGKVALIADYSGLLKVNVPLLQEVNAYEQIVFATLHSNQFVHSAQRVASCGVVPLVVSEEKISQIENFCHAGSALILVKPLSVRRVGIVTTGSEVYAGRIQDKFGPVIQQKLTDLGSLVMGQTIVPDDRNRIVQAIHKYLQEGTEMVVVTGGMSVDPDDLTPSAIRNAGGEVITYGAPVLPGAMFMLAKIDGIPVLGLPGCVMYHKATVLDLVLPRILAGEEVSRRDITNLGYGGLCRGCESCHFPACSFGKS